MRVPSPVELYVDGSAGAALGPAISRLDFHKVIEVDLSAAEGGPLEIRQRHLSIVIPTAALVEFLTKTLIGIQTNRENLLQLMEDSVKSVRVMLDNTGSRNE